MSEEKNDNNKTAPAKTAADIMNKNVITVGPQENICAAAKLMADKDIGSVVVLNDKEPIGIITERDLTRKVAAKQLDYSKTNVEQVMSSPLICVSGDLSLAKASQMMREKSIKRLVVTCDRNLIGIVTQTDILEATKKILQKQASHTQEKLQQSYRDIQQIAMEANQAARETMLSSLTNNHFVASMSHEIRTPLNAIIGLSEVLSDDNMSEEQKNHVAIIRESAQNMLVLINDILDFSKIEAGKFDIEIGECSLEHLLAVVESLMRPRVIEKGLEFEIYHQTELPAVIKTDNLRLRQCLMNFINNAIDFTEKGHVHLNVNLEEINNQPHIKFDVEDTGIGIAPERLENIFEQFTQAHQLQNRSRRGTGLGLAITKKLATLLGGTVSVKSKVGAGSTFTLVIPAGVDAQSQQTYNKHGQITNLRTEKKAPIEKRFKGHVLVAEDTPTNQTLIRLLLEKLGMTVVMTQDGNEAVKAALSQEFDLVLMDIQMPHMNGYDATKQLRKQGYNKPIIAVTAHAMQGDKEKCLAAGCDDYISKPIDRNQLTEILTKYISDNDNLSKKLDSVTNQVKELTQICSSTGENIMEQANVNGTLSADELIDWNAMMNICDDESVIQQVVEMFRNDSPKCVQSLAEAIKSANPKFIKMYAHSLKGASLQIGAKRLGEIAYKLECAGRDKLMDRIPNLFNELQDEYSKLTLFLSQPNWMELAKNSKK